MPAAALAVVLLLATLVGESAAQLQMSYAANPVQYVLQVDIGSNAFSTDGHICNSFSVFPPLPNGLTIDSGSGALSGVPTVESPQRQYQVSLTCVSPSGTFSTTILLGVVAPAPSFSPDTPVVSAITIGDSYTFTPTFAGSQLPALSLEPPALPAGLSFNSTTGVISGSPTAEASTAWYKIIATTSGGTAVQFVSITVNPVASTTVDSRISKAQNDANLALEVSFITLTAGLLFSMFAILIFLAWRSRKQQSAPPMLISDQMIEKLGRTLRDERKKRKKAVDSEDEAEANGEETRGLKSSTSRESVESSRGAPSDVFGSRMAVTRNLAHDMTSGDAAPGKDGAPIMNRSSSSASVYELAHRANEAAKDRSSEQTMGSKIASSHSTHNLLANSVKAAKTTLQLFKALGIEKEGKMLLDQDIPLDQLQYLDDEDLNTYIPDAAARAKLEAYLEPLRNSEE